MVISKNLGLNKPSNTGIINSSNLNSNSTRLEKKLLTKLLTGFDLVHEKVNNKVINIYMLNKDNNI